MGVIISDRFKFNRLELAGSLGDLGTLLPIAIAMVLINGLSPVGIFFSIAVFYIVSGLFFGVTVPVQPMKVIGAYAIASAVSPSQILASSLLMGIFILIIGLTGTIDFIRRYTPQSVIRGVQLTTGTILISSGIKFIIGTSKFQIIQNAAEPFLSIQLLGSVNIGIIIGLAGGIVSLLLLNNKKFPAGLIIVLGGVITGLLLGAKVSLSTETLWFNFPEFLPFGLPGNVDFTFALFVLVLPQIPMTMGNAVFAYTDLSKKYFGDNSSKVTNRNVCISMALANFLSFFLGGIPLCHGAGGLAAHYRFGARTAGSNLIIGLIFLILTLLFGNDIINMLNIIPMSILGVLLVFSGTQLTLTIMDLKKRQDYFVATLILGIALASNLAIGFISGIIIAQLLRWKKLSV